MTNEDDTFKALQKWTYQDAFDYSLLVVRTSGMSFDGIEELVFEKTGWLFDDIQKKRSDDFRRLERSK